MTSYSRPLPADDIAGLGSVAEGCDVLRGWGRPNLADRLAYFASDEDLDDGDVPLTLESALGFLAFFGAVESEGSIDVTCSQEGWLCVGWRFDDERNAALWFLDGDRVMFTANGTDGKFIDIPSGSKIATRPVLWQKLVQEGLFRWHKDLITVTTSRPITT